jgi:tyrosine-protein phosphatase SIW14
MAFVRLAAGWLLAFAVPAVPAAYASYRMTTWRHFRVVEEGRLYRSGQLAPPALDRVVREQGITTVICLRALARPGDAAPEDAEERWCAARGIRYVRLNPAQWGSPTCQANLKAFLRVTDDRTSGPILVHCFAGLHRTGVFCAVYRMERQGWSNADAIAEMYAVGYFQEDPTALEFLRNYVPDTRKR